MSEPRLRSKPEICPGAYDLHLYCRYDNAEHGFNEFPWEINEHQTYGAAAARARGMGWVLHRDGTASCPRCVAALGLRCRAALSTGEQG